MVAHSSGLTNHFKKNAASEPGRRCKPTIPARKSFPASFFSALPLHSDSIPTQVATKRVDAELVETKSFQGKIQLECLVKIAPYNHLPGSQRKLIFHLHFFKRCYVSFGGPTSFSGCLYWCQIEMLLPKRFSPWLATASFLLQVQNKCQHDATATATAEAFSPCNSNTISWMSYKSKEGFKSPGQRAKLYVFPHNGPLNLSI